ncbi:MAG: hypothetical protein KJZ69_05600 [Phycisphaerales bacterium]|nr:hypothetical protein [Phycisphaerales bacterium]
MAQIHDQTQAELPLRSDAHFPHTMQFRDDRDVIKFGRLLSRLADAQREPSSEYEFKCGLFDAIRIDQMESGYSISVIGHDPLVDPLFSNAKASVAINGLLRWIRKHSLGQT